MGLLNPVLAERLAGAARCADPTFLATYLHTFALHPSGKRPKPSASSQVHLSSTSQRMNAPCWRCFGSESFWVLGLTDRAIQVLDDAQRWIPVESQSVLVAHRALIGAANGSSLAAIEAANARWLEAFPTSRPRTPTMRW